MSSLFDRFRSAIHRGLQDGANRILVAEDHGDFAGVISLLLTRCGFDVRTAHDGRVVLAMALAFRPHFVLLDIHMPGVGGYQLAERLCGESDLAGVVIIGIWAYSPAPPSGVSTDAHFDHFLRKPFEMETLLSLLRPA